MTPPTRSTSRGSQAHLVPGPCHASLLTPCTPGRAGACIEKRMRGGWWTESPHPTALACWPAFQPHSLVVLRGSQGAGRASCFHWATDQVLLSGRQQGSATDDTLQEPNCVPGLPQLLPLTAVSSLGPSPGTCCLCLRSPSRSDVTFWTHQLTSGFQGILSGCSEKVTITNLPV